jgi:hypothetical protein
VKSLIPEKKRTQVLENLKKKKTPDAHGRAFLSVGLIIPLETKLKKKKENKDPKEGREGWVGCLLWLGLAPFLLPVESHSE